MKNVLRILAYNIESEDKIKSLLALPIISHETQVQFALWCAQSSLQYIDHLKYPNAYQKVTHCLELVADWLLGKPISNEELNAAANAAAYAAYAAQLTHLIGLLSEQLACEELTILYG